jgi:hypothetical protein
MWSARSGGTVAYFDATSWAADTVIGSADLNDVWGTTQDAVLIAVGEAGAVYQWRSGSWSALPPAPGSPNLNSVWGLTSDVFYVVGDDGVGLEYDNGDWTTIATGTSLELYGVWGTGNFALVIVGESGVAINGTGTIWDLEETGVTVDLYAVYGITSTSVMAGGAWNHILRYID